MPHPWGGGDTPLDPPWTTHLSLTPLCLTERRERETGAGGVQHPLEPHPQLPGGSGAGFGSSGEGPGSLPHVASPSFVVFFGGVGVSQAIFRKFDLDKSGSISSYELRLALEAAGRTPLSPPTSLAPPLMNRTPPHRLGVLRVPLRLQAEQEAARAADHPLR